MASTTKLQTERTINGVPPNGTENIIITAEANGGNSNSVNGVGFRVNDGKLQYSIDNGVTWNNVS